MSRKRNVVPAELTEGRRKFAEWVEGANLADLARRLEVTRSWVSSVAQGKTRPSIDLAYRIEQMTFGSIKTSLWAQPAKGKQAA
jgi:transcriptional regulator with XRE-family HTH domain